MNAVGQFRGESAIHDTGTLCARCLRCGRRSILGRSEQLNALPDASGTTRAQLRCDICGGRRIELVHAQGPTEVVAFISGRR
ncbi:hypothetical protein GCM10028812_10400 [Ancylobacter sonchi]